MKILKKYNTLFNYTIDPFYFEKNSEATYTQYRSSYWRVGTESSYILQYDIFFYAKNPSSGVHFINYHTRYELECLIEDIEAAAKEIIKFKEIINLSTQLFLMENAQDYYHLFDFREMRSINGELSLEIISIKRIMGILTLEEMSEEERNFVLKNNQQ